MHDAARPLADADAVRRGGRRGPRPAPTAPIPAVPVTDTLRAPDGGVVDRDALVAVQTPQGFRATALRAAHARGAEATDDAALVEAVGGRS